MKQEIAAHNCHCGSCIITAAGHFCRVCPKIGRDGQRFLNGSQETPGRVLRPRPPKL